VQSFDGVRAGSFTAPDHDYPSYLELIATATDAQGMATWRSISLSPRAVAVTIDSSPAGLPLTAASTSAVTPFEVTAIAGAQTWLSAPHTQVLGTRTLHLLRWSDGARGDHSVLARAGARFTAIYGPPSGVLLCTRWPACRARSRPPPRPQPR
jgi:hypothetical protein